MYVCRRGAAQKSARVIQGVFVKLWGDERATKDANDSSSNNNNASKRHGKGDRGEGRP